VAVAKCLGGSLFWDTVYSAVVCVCVCGCVDQLDKLLDCQKPSRTAADTHDEHLLIVTHQGHYMRTH